MSDAQKKKREKGRILNDIGNFENPKIALIISVMV